LIEEHLPDLASKRYDRIAASLGQTVEDIQDMADIIRGFHPKPGILEQNHAPKYIIPDVYVDRVVPGKYVVQVNDGVLPHVRFNEDYENLVQDQGEASKYLQDRLQQYRWLIRSIDQRKETLLRVTEAVIERQLEFFEQEQGERHPLSLKEIAAELDIHESTVSRATNHKYVQTPRGVFELKYFFAKRVPLANGAYTSDAQVKRLIRDLIDQEDKKKPFSDQKIADQISMRGIQLARRTVAKYREQLGILSSSKRKQAH
jgi:RNA polymerase sigma-54 factor